MSTPSDSIPNQEAMNAFLDFVKNEIHNPPKVSELFKIPIQKGLAPDWQNIFEKVAAYYERECAADRHALISLEKRSWIMEDEGLSEIEMVMSSVKAKEKGNVAFRQKDFLTAFLYYIFAVQTFPTPDVMNNLAACALQLSHFDVAEKYATRALDMGLFANPASICKALFRRSNARFHLARFGEALKDCQEAHALSPTETSITDLMAKIRETMEDVNSDVKIAAFLEKQSKPATPIPWEEGMVLVKDRIETGYIRVPVQAQGHMVLNVAAPTF